MSATPMLNDRRIEIYRAQNGGRPMTVTQKRSVRKAGKRKIARDRKEREMAAASKAWQIRASQGE